MSTYPTGQLRLVQYNDQPVIEYVYDSNNNLIGEPETPSGAIFEGPRRLYLNASLPTGSTSGYEGTWTSTSGAATAQMSPAREGAATETEIAAPSCEEGDTALVTTFVSTPLSSARTFQSGEQVRVVIGARQGDGGDALQAVATLWVMNDSGGERCTIRTDWLLAGAAVLPSGSDSKGIGDYTGPGQCSGIELHAGDRVVAEFGYRCTTDEEVEGAISRGGKGPALTAGGDPTDHPCGQPGYVEFDGDWAFASDTPTPCEADNVQTVLTRQLDSVEIDGNRAIGAILTEPDGTDREYAYEYDTSGALMKKTDVISGEETEYEYDEFGNLRHVTLPDESTIDYLIDAANRRVGRVLKDSTGGVIDEKRWLYQSALRPVAELDGGNNVKSFFVYADKPNVPEYMVKDETDYRIITDHLGSVRLVVNSTTGAIAQRIDYDEWGNVTQDTNPGFQPFGFAGGLHDSDARLMRFGARDFDSDVGRWVAPDPVGYGGQQGNLWEYASGDPVNTSDPTGLRVFSEQESRELLTQARDEAMLPYTGTIHMIVNHNLKKFDCKGERSTPTVSSADRFVVNGTLYSPTEFGNYMAGYVGVRWGGDFGYKLVRSGGLAWALLEWGYSRGHEARDCRRPRPSQVGSFGYDFDSVPDIDAGALRARREISPAGSLLVPCP